MQKLSLFVGIVYLAISQAAPSGSNFTTLAAALEDAEKFILHFNDTYNFPSLVFGLSVKNKPVIKKAWGFADLENWVPAKVSTRYRIASVTKTFTSALIGQLVDQGKVHYNDPISRYLPESIFPTKSWQGHPVNITVRQLLSHTAGLHITDVERDFTHVSHPQTITQMIGQFKDEPLLFEPGTNFGYSNYGFQLAGAIIESVTAKPFPVVLTEFLHAHQLDSSYVGDLWTILHNSARSYMSKNYTELKENVPSLLEEVYFVDGYWASGGVVSNVDDLLHYGQLMIDAYHGRPNAGECFVSCVCRFKPRFNNLSFLVISKKTLTEMWTAQTHQAQIPFSVQSEYGFGWCVATSNNTKLAHQDIFWHEGGLLGDSAMLVVYPQEEIVGVALVNKGVIIELLDMVVHTVENVYDLVK